MRAGPAGGASKASSFRSRCLKFHNFVPSDQTGHRGGPDSTRLQEQHGTKKITVASTPWLPGVQPLSQGQTPQQGLLLTQQNCRSPETLTAPHHAAPHPIGSIVPATSESIVVLRAPLSSPHAAAPSAAAAAAASSISRDPLTLLCPAIFAPTTHLTPEVTITPIVGRGSGPHGGSSNNSSSSSAISDGNHVNDHSGEASMGGTADISDFDRKRISEDVRRLLNLKISRKDPQRTQRDEQPLDLSLKRDVSEMSAGSDDDIQIIGFEPGLLGPALMPRPMALYTHLASPASPQLGPGHPHLPHVPLQLPLTLPSPSSVNPLLVQQLALQSQRHMQCRPSRSKDSTSYQPAVPSNTSGMIGQNQQDRLSSGILVKTKQVSEVGGATFCKFRQMKPAALGTTATRTGAAKAKRFNFVRSRWPGQHRPSGSGHPD